MMVLTEWTDLSACKKMGERYKRKYKMDGMYKKSQRNSAYKFNALIMKKGSV